MVLFLILGGTSISFPRAAARSLHSYQRCSSVPFLPHPHQHLLSYFVLFCFVSDKASLICVLCYLTVLWVCISLMASDKEHCFQVPVGHPYTPGSPAALLTKAKMRKQPKGPLPNEWIKKMRRTHTAECLVTSSLQPCTSAQQ